MSTIIALIRHGVTDWNLEGRMQGRNDIPLNAEGRRQAELLGQRLAAEQWDLLYSSNLSRAKETAEIIGQYIGIPLSGSEPSLAERSFGDLEGTTELDRIQRWGIGWRQMNHGEETREAATSRALGLLDKLHHEHEGKRILVVSHGAVIGAIVEHLFPSFGYIGLKNTCVNILQRQHQSWDCLLHNCVKHLEEDVGGLEG